MKCFYLLPYSVGVSSEAYIPKEDQEERTQFNTVPISTQKNKKKIVPYIRFFRFDS